MANHPTVSDLRKISEVADDEITAAVDAVHKASQDALLTERDAYYKRDMVRTAILLAHPVTG